MNNYTSLLLLLLIAGCTVKGEYSCGVPNNGVRCQPMDETHQQLYAGTLTSLHVEPFPQPETEVPSDGDDYLQGFDDASYFGIPDTPPARLVDTTPSIVSIPSKQAILSQPREMRIWFDRYTDPDGDLNDESFVFIRLDNGHWIIDNKPVLY